MFNGSGNITKVNFGPKVRHIGENAFYQCFYLREVNFNEGLLTIGAHAFYMDYLPNITLPSTLTSIGYRAFAETGVTSLFIPSSVTVMEEAFYDCYCITSVEFENPVGWKLYSSSTATTGTEVQISATDFAVNAQLFDPSSAYQNKYWKRG